MAHSLVGGTTHKLWMTIVSIFNNYNYYISEKRLPGKHVNDFCLYSSKFCPLLLFYLSFMSWPLQKSRAVTSIKLCNTTQMETHHPELINHSFSNPYFTHANAYFKKFKLIFSFFHPLCILNSEVI